MILIINAIILSLMILMIHVSFWDGMIFGKIRSSYLYQLPSLIRKPLYECHICMCSLWCVIMFPMFYDILSSDLIVMIRTMIKLMLCSGGMLVLISPIVWSMETINGERFVDSNKQYE